MADDKVLGILLRVLGAQQASAQIAGVSRSVGGLHTNSATLGKVLRTDVSNAMTTFKGRVSQLGTAVAGVAGIGGIIGLSAALKDSVTSADTFGQAMELLKTQAGYSQAEVDSMSQSVLNLAKTTAEGPQSLAQAMYHIASAGLHGAQALSVLTAAAQGAAVGGADLESVTNALIAANQSGVKGVQNMSQAMGTLNAIVGAGNMRMQDLTDAMGTGVLSTAKNYGVTIQSVGAALASMTDQGIPAIDAATRLNSAMRLMAAPTSKATKELKRIGLDQYRLANDMRGPGGILAAIEDLKSHLDKSGLSATKQAALIARAFGGKQSGAILTLIGNVGLLQKKQDAVNAGASGFGDAVASAEQTAAYKLANFQSVMQATAIKVGNVLLPLLTDATGAIGGWVASHQDDIVAAVQGAAAIAKTVFGTLSTMVNIIKTGWDAIPGPLRDLLVGGIAADRTVKFLFGFSPINALKNGLIGIFSQGSKSLGGQLAQTLLGGVQKVWVVNMGKGGLGGGGLGSGPGGSGGMGGFLTSFLGTLGIMFESKGGLDALTSEYQNLQAGNTKAAMNDVASLTSPGTMIARGIFGTSDPIGDWIKSTFGISVGYRPQDSAAASQRLTPSMVGQIGPTRNAFGAQVGGASPEERGILQQQIAANVKLQGIKDASMTTASQARADAANARADQQRIRAGQIYQTSVLQAIEDKRQSIAVNVTAVVNAFLSGRDVTRSVSHAATKTSAYAV